MERLPTELIELIFHGVTIDELLCLRLVCQNFRAIIDRRINALAPQVARNTFPKARLLLRPPPNRKYDLRWLKGLIPKRLASIIVDRQRDKHQRHQPRIGLPAEEIFGDELRGKVENGWRVYKRLSNISKAVYALPESEVPSVESELNNDDPETRRRNDYLENIRINATGPVTTHELLMGMKMQPDTCKDDTTGGEMISAFFSRFPRRLRRKSKHRVFSTPIPKLSVLPDELSKPVLTDIEKREHLVWKRSTQLIGGLSDEESSDYGLLHSLLFWIFESETPLNLSHELYGEDAPHVIFAFDFDWDEEHSGYSNTVNLVHANSWVNRYLLHEGPDLFWNQWKCEHGGVQDQNQHYIRDALRLAWAERSDAQVAIERKYGVFINNTMRIQASWRHSRYWEPLTFYSSYRGYSSDSIITFYNKYRLVGTENKGQSIIAWYAWMRGVNVDDNFHAWEYHKTEGLPYLDAQCFDSLEDVAYSVYL
jgi:hypothetical protein